MAAGLNQMVANQSTLAIKNHNTEHRVKTHTDLAGLIRQSLKYKNTASQKTYRDTELQILRGGKKKKKEEEVGKGAKEVALQTSPATCRHPGVTGLYPGPPEKGGLGLGPTRNQNSSSLPRGGDQSPILSSG